VRDPEWCKAEGIPECVLELARWWSADYFQRTGKEHDVRALVTRRARTFKDFDDVFLGDHVSRTLQKIREAKERGEKWPPSYEEIRAARERHEAEPEDRCEPGTCVICDGRWEP